MKRRYVIILYWVMINERVLDVKLRKSGAKGSLIDLILNLYELRLQIAGTIMAPVHDFFGSLSLCPKGIFTLALYLSAFELELPAQTNLANITNHFCIGICFRRDMNVYGKQQNCAMLRAQTRNVILPK